MLSAKKSKNVSDPEATLAAVPAGIADSIRQAWAGGNIAAGNGDHDAVEVQRFLEELHGRDRCIVCDCVPPTVKQPILFVFRTQAGRYGLRRRASRGEHAPSCVFHWAEGQLGTRTPTLLPSFLLIHPSSGSGRGGGAGGGEAKGGAPSMLEQRALWLLSHADVARYDPDRPTLNHGLLRVREVAPEARVTGSIKLSDVLWTHPDWLSKGWAASAVNRLDWPSGSVKQGFFLVPARCGGARQIYVDGTSYEIRGRLHDRTVPEMPSVALVLAQFGDDGADPALRSAYVFSVHPNSLAPVFDSEHKACAGFLSWLAKKAREEHRAGADSLFVRLQWSSGDGSYALEVGRSDASSFMVAVIGEASTREVIDGMVVRQSDADWFVLDRARFGGERSNRQLASKFFGWLGGGARR